MMNLKTILAIVLFAFLFALVAYAQSESIGINLFGNPTITNASIVCEGNLSCSQSGNNITLVGLNGTKGDKGDPGANGINATIVNSSCNTANETLLNYNNVSGWSCKDFNSSVNSLISQQINLSNISGITGNNGIVTTTLPDGSSNITNVTVSGGIIATWI